MPSITQREHQTKVRSAPAWNEVHIVARGDRLTHSINGVQMSKVIDKNQACRDPGLIAIELHADAPMTVQVRRLRIRTASTFAATRPEIPRIKMLKYNLTYKRLKMSREWLSLKQAVSDCCRFS
ncbi:family 16 glycoside hydrolase [Crateriforma conspicua]|uniref:family 16 glycoside hydrolase n=1 Tax=Crateriforma conspicua TaxID=2527996 RepID=UPI00118BAB90|nr:family 16 glycoside hydrolase [Crateriforma conspicua]QDV62596.1 hypothetical protein Mal65_17300 [Crateriforma conspicua]